MYALIIFVAIMLVVFPFAVIASLFGRIKGGNIIMRLCRFWADSWFAMVFIFHKRIYEAPHSKTKPYIFVANHISYLDAATLVKAIRQPLRPLGKYEMNKLPIFGFIYRNAIITVNRSSATNRSNSVRLLKSVIKKGISILIFPEGTFNMTMEPLKEFYDGAFRVAIETQTPIKPVLFLDAYRRMPYESIFSLTPGCSRLLFLSEIAVDRYTLADVGALKKEVFDIMLQKMIAYNAAWKNNK